MTGWSRTKGYFFRVSDFMGWGIRLSLLPLALCLVTQAQGPESSNFSQELEKYQQAVAENPNSVEAHLSLGFAYLAMDAMEQAEIAFQKALQLDPTSVQGAYWLDEPTTCREDMKNPLLRFRRRFACFLTGARRMES